MARLFHLKINKLTILFTAIIIASGTVFLTQVSSEEGKIPNWVKSIAGWWAEDKISESEFINAIEFLISQGIIKPPIITTLQNQVNELQEKLDAAHKRISSLEQQIAELGSVPSSTDTSTSEPDLSTEKRLASAWAKGQITDAQYIQEIQKLMDNGTIKPFEGKQEQTPQTSKEPIPHVPTTHTIQFPFDTSEPKHLTIYLGDSIKWVNSDNGSHTVTSGTKETGYDGKFFDRTLSPNTSTSSGFGGTGTFTFFCKYYGHNEELGVDVTAEYREVTIPTWVKNNAGWWANGQISDDDYRQGLSYLFKNGYLHNP